MKTLTLLIVFVLIFQRMSYAGVDFSMSGAPKQRYVTVEEAREKIKNRRLSYWQTKQGLWYEVAIIFQTQDYEDAVIMYIEGPVNEPSVRKAFKKVHPRSKILQWEILEINVGNSFRAASWPVKE